METPQDILTEILRTVREEGIEALSPGKLEVYLDYTKRMLAKKRDEEAAAVKAQVDPVLQKVDSSSEELCTFLSDSPAYSLLPGTISVTYTKYLDKATGKAGYQRIVRTNQANEAPARYSKAEKVEEKPDPPAVVLKNSVIVE